MKPNIEFGLDSNIGFLVSDAHRLITATVDKSMKPLGLTRSQLRVLMHLLRHDGHSQVQIAEQLDLGKVAIGGLIDRLEEKNLVERRVHPSDRRAKRVYLTPKVEELYQPLQSLGTQMMKGLLKDISNDQYLQLVEQLKTIKANCHHMLDSEPT